MSRPSESFKDIAAKLATLLPADNDNLEQVEKLLAQLGYANNTPDNANADPGEGFSANHVGIYKREDKNGETYYHRDVDFKQQWSYYADVPTIPPKSSKKRVVLLGESVARGFLLDPGYTPAFVLGTLLNANGTKEEYEVIDLAETNLGMPGLRQRFQQCLALEPDLVLFLAGNNWGGDLISLVGEEKEQYEKLEAAAKVGGVGNTKQILENRFAEMVRSFLTEVGDTARQHQFSVIFTIPEFNLLDCRSTPGERFVSKLPVEDMEAWIDARVKTEEYAAKGNFEQCEEHARKMVELDPSHPIGFEFRADNFIKQYKFDEARQCLEMARDTALFCRTNSKPRIFHVIQKTIAEEAPKHDIEVVNLKEVFKTFLNGQIPGRDLFLDYCHFTALGIQVGMDPVYRKVLAAFGDQSNDSLQAKDIKADRDVMALGHLFAAIHNAHWGQSFNILYHHCREALSHSKDMAKTMVYYCDMISRKTSNNLCKSLEKIIEGNSKLDRYIHALIPPRDMKNMELELVEAMSNALKSFGIDLSEYIKKLRITEYGVVNRKVDLLKRFYHASSYDEYLGSKTAFFQARDIYSNFFIVAQTDHEIHLDFTLRLVDIPQGKNAKVSVFFNNHLLTELSASSQWDNYSIAIPAKYVQDDVNHLTIEWPMVSTEPQAEATQGETGSILDAVYQVFGEIISLSAIGKKVESPVSEAVG